MNDLLIVLQKSCDLFPVLQTKDEIKILEIGTGNGENSTKMLYNFFKNKKKSFQIISYEGDTSYFNRANHIWSKVPNVKIINEFFTMKKDIEELLLPNIPEYIIDYNETNERLKSKYISVLKNDNNKYFTNLMYIPDIILIDSSRFMHLPIINLCYEVTKTNPNTIIIMEDDYFVNDNFGELEIIQKHFNLKNVVKYNKVSWQWPFVSFNIVSKK